MASSVDWHDLMGSYPADYRSDEDLQRLDGNFTAGANHVMTMSSSGLDRFKQSILYLRNSDQQAVETIMSCKAQILATKGRVATKIEKFLDSYLIKQFLENSNQTLELCQVELPDFIRKANKIISCIKDLVRDRNMSKLKKARDDCQQSAKLIVAKVEALQKKHLNLLNKLGKEFKKLDAELKRTRILRKVAQVIFMGFLSTVFACGVIAAVMAIPGVAPAITTHPGITAFIAATSIAQTSSAAIKVGQHWLLTMIRESESTLQARKEMIESMQSGTKDHITVLSDILSHVEKVLARTNDSRLTADEEPVVIQFKKEIEELDNTRKECIPIIERARKKVDQEYENLKKMLSTCKRK